jgi:hypothetical protein
VVLREYAGGSGVRELSGEPNVPNTSDGREEGILDLFKR